MHGALLGRCDVVDATRASVSVGEQLRKERHVVPVEELSAWGLSKGRGTFQHQPNKLV